MKIIGIVLVLIGGFQTIVSLLNLATGQTVSFFGLVFNKSFHQKESRITEKQAVGIKRFGINSTR